MKIATVNSVDVRLNRDGSGVSPLFSKSDHQYAPTWSPDGTQIAFISFNQFTDPRPQIDVTNADRRGRKRITTAAASTFSPDWTGPGQLTTATELVAQPAIARIGPGRAIYLTFTAELSSNVTSLAGKTIEFSRDGQVVCTETNAQGVAKCGDAIDAVLSVSNGYDASFVGDAIYTSSKAHEPVIDVGQATPIPNFLAGDKSLLALFLPQNHHKRAQLPFSCIETYKRGFRSNRVNANHVSCRRGGGLVTR